MTTLAGLAPIARTQQAMVIAGAGLPGASRPSFTTHDLACRPVEVQAAFDAQWGSCELSDAQIALKRECAERRAGAASLDLFATATDGNFNRREPFPAARHLRGSASTRRCLACGVMWSPRHPARKPKPCCLATSRPAVALDDELPTGRIAQQAQEAAVAADVIVGIGIEARDRVVLERILVPGSACERRILIDRDPADEVAAYFDTVVEGAPIRALLTLFPPAPPQ